MSGDFNTGASIELILPGNGGGVFVLISLSPPSPPPPYRPPLPWPWLGSSAGSSVSTMSTILSKMEVEVLIKQSQNIQHTSTFRGIHVDFWIIIVHTSNWNSLWIFEDLGIIEFIWIIKKIPRIGQTWHPRPARPINWSKLTKPTRPTRPPGPTRPWRVLIQDPLDPPNPVGPPDPQEKPDPPGPPSKQDPKDSQDPQDIMRSSWKHRENIMEKSWEDLGTI